MFIGQDGKRRRICADSRRRQHAALNTVATVLPQTPATSEDPEPEIAIASDFAEGERQKRETTFFKRNPKLRREAIRLHGAICIACKFNFEKRYGEAGKGYIEIHHLN